MERVNRVGSLERFHRRGALFPAATSGILTEHAAETKGCIHVGVDDRPFLLHRLYRLLHYLVTDHPPAIHRRYPSTLGHHRMQYRNHMYLPTDDATAHYPKARLRKFQEVTQHDAQ